jgi:septum formation protein
MEPIILASSSIRRQDILRQMAIPFTVMPSKFPETLSTGLSPVEQTVALARRKVEYVLEMIRDRAVPWALGADTLIAVDGQLVGKPESREEAKALLQRFSGRSHRVTTGVALYSNKRKQVDVTSSENEIRFATMSDEQMEWYLDSGEWQGVAGGYRIQGKAACFIERIEGSYSSIVGLPIRELYDILLRNGYDFGR